MVVDVCVCAFRVPTWCLSAQGSNIVSLCCMWELHTQTHTQPQVDYTMSIWVRFSSTHSAHSCDKHCLIKRGVIKGERESANEMYDVYMHECVIYLVFGSHMRPDQHVPAVFGGRGLEDEIKGHRKFRRDLFAHIRQT